MPNSRFLPVLPEAGTARRWHCPGVLSPPQYQAAGSSRQWVTVISSSGTPMAA